MRIQDIQATADDGAVADLFGEIPLDEISEAARLAAARDPDVLLVLMYHVNKLSAALAGIPLGHDARIDVACRGRSALTYVLAEIVRARRALTDGTARVTIRHAANELH